MTIDLQVSISAALDHIMAIRWLATRRRAARDGPQFVARPLRRAGRTQLYSSGNET
jgi:hypothetical protein